MTTIVRRSARAGKQDSRTKVVTSTDSRTLRRAVRVGLMSEENANEVQAAVENAAEPVTADVPAPAPTVEPAATAPVQSFEPVTADAPAPSVAPPPAPTPPPASPPAAGAPAAGAPAQWPSAAYAAPAAAAPAYQPAGYGYQQAPAPAQTSSNAVIAIILAALSWAFCPIIAAIVALIFAHQASKEIEASGGRIQGQGLVTASRWVAWINIGLFAAMIVIGGFVLLLVAIAGGMSSN
jgi:hypothetical protein